MTEFGPDVVDSVVNVLATLIFTSSLINKIKEAQKDDEALAKIMTIIQEKPEDDFQVHKDDSLWFRGSLCVPDDDSLRNEILEEAHSSRLSIHPGANKMYQDLKKNYWWIGMKRQIAEYVERCLVC